MTKKLTLEELIKRRKQIEAKLIELDEERKILENDLENIKEGVSAASKVAMEESLSDYDNEVLKDYKENYPAFIDSDDEEGPPSLLNKFRQLRKYFTSELKVNAKSMNTLTEKRADTIAQTEKQTAQASSSKTTSNTPTSDYIDDLPDQPYNPLDDID